MSYHQSLAENDGVVGGFNSIEKKKTVNPLNHP